VRASMEPAPWPVPIARVTFARRRATLPSRRRAGARCAAAHMARDERSRTREPVS